MSGELGLKDFISSVIRRYDILVKVHTELYLKENKKEEENKRILTAIFVEKTLEDLISVCKNSDHRQTVVNYVYKYTDRVITECHNNCKISTEALPQVGFYYLYGLHLLPSCLISELKKLETVCYRDVECVYNRYVAVKTAMVNVFDKLSNCILRLIFGK